MDKQELKELVVNNLLLLSAAEKIRDKNTKYCSNFMKLDYICSKINESHIISYQLLLDTYFKNNEEEMKEFISKKQN
jgi:hypothetical protein